MHKAWWQKHRARFLFFAILLGGLLLRLLFVHSQGLSNDELSAWSRATMSWGDFFQVQVMEGDMHPFLYQFLFKVWLSFFGSSDWGIRSLALLFYVLNFLVLYKIAKTYFGNSTASWVCVFFAFSGFLIVNQSTSRPYSIGLFFILIVLWFALRWLKEQQINKVSLLILGASISAALLSHYFAGLVAAIIGLILFVFLDKANRKKWFLMVLISSFIFLPHSGITWYQLNQGGLGWLAAPNANWLVEFMALVLQNNTWWAILFVLLTFLLMWKSGAWSREQRFIGNALFIIIGTSWGISLWFTPILRELVFQFMWPLILLFSFSFLEKKNPKERAFLSFVPFLFILSLAGYPMMERVHYGEFEDLVQSEKNFEKQGGGLIVENCISPNYLSFYSGINRPSPVLDWGAQDAPYLLAQKVREADVDRAMYVWTNNINLPIFWEIFRLKFPTVSSSKLYFNSGVVIYDRQKTNQDRSRAVDFDFATHVQDSSEFLFGHSLPVSCLTKFQSDSSYFSVQLDMQDKPSDQVYLVVTLNRDGQMRMENDQPVLYTAYTSALVPTDGKKLVNAFQLPKEVNPTDELQIYVWNQAKEKVAIRSAKLISYRLFNE